MSGHNGFAAMPDGPSTELNGSSREGSNGYGITGLVGSAGEWPADLPSEDWQVLLLAVRDRLQMLTDEVAGHGPARLTAPSLAAVDTTVRDCRVALDRVRGLLLTEQAGQQRPIDTEATRGGEPE